jgi:hypothetical protein
MSIDGNWWGNNSRVLNLQEEVAKHSTWWKRLVCRFSGHKWNGYGQFCWRCGVKP